MQVEVTDLVEISRSIQDVHISLGEIRNYLNMNKDRNETKSSNLNEIFSALAKAQTEMSIAGLHNDNPFFKSKYADLATLVKASRPALTKNGLCVIQQIVPDNDGKLMLKTILGHCSGQWIESQIYINPSKSDIQSLGSYITYLKRYCYAALVGIVTGDEDDDGEAAMQQDRRLSQPVQPRVITISQDQLTELEYELDGLPDLAQDFLTKMGISRLADLPQAKYRACLDRIREIKILQKAK